MGLKDSESAPLESWTSTTIHIRNSEIEECKKKKKKKNNSNFFFWEWKKKKIKEKNMGTCTFFFFFFLKGYMYIVLWYTKVSEKESNFDIQKYQK